MIYIFEVCPDNCLLLVSNFIPLWSEHIYLEIPVFWNLLMHMVCFGECFIWTRNECVFCTCWVWMSIRLSWFIMFRFSVALLIFFLLLLFFSFYQLWGFVSLDLLLGTYTFRVLCSKWLDPFIVTNCSSVFFSWSHGRILI